MLRTNKSHDSCLATETSLNNCERIIKACGIEFCRNKTLRHRRRYRWSFFFPLPIKGRRQHVKISLGKGQPHRALRITYIHTHRDDKRNQKLYGERRLCRHTKATISAKISLP